MSIFDSLAKLFGTKTAASPRPVVSAPPPPPKPPRNTPSSRRIFDRQGSTDSAISIPAEADIEVNLTGAKSLRDLAGPIRTGSLKLAGCKELRSLPAGIEVAFLNLSDCSALAQLPHDLRLRGGALNLSGCAGLTSLPDDLGEVAVLDLSGCPGITELPQGLVVTSWIDVAGSGLTGLHELFDPVGVCWNGVPVSRKVAFAPHTITADDIAAEQDPRVRQVMEERAA